MFVVLKEGGARHICVHAVALPRLLETLLPSQSQTLKPSTDRHSGTEEETEGESKPESSSKQPSTPTRPAVSLTSPKVTIYIYYVTV